MLILLLPLAVLLASGARAETAADIEVEAGKSILPPETPAQTDARLAWWRDARFGMFIHWGPVSLNGTEIGWSRGRDLPRAEYDRLYTRFNPTKFDADEWVAIAKAAGMKYIVLTCKHHDGFCLWDSAATNYDIMQTPYARDVVQALAEACARAGIRFCTYYSVCDWHNPDFLNTSPESPATYDPNNRFVRRATYNLDHYELYVRAQVRELITKYHSNLMWFDVPQDFGARGYELIDYCRSLNPNIIINNRAGGGAPGDYDTPEQRVGTYQDDRPWETCMTICRQWAWKPNDTMKSLRECLRTLVLSAGGDGNLLLNVGPMPDGRIESRQVERLKEMGDWLAQYGDTIYGTRGGPWKPTRSVAATRKGDTAFIHILRQRAAVLRLPAIGAKLVSARLHADGTPVKFEQSAAEIVLWLPPADPALIDRVVALTFDRDLAGAAALAQDPDYHAAASGTAAGDSAAGAFDGDPDTHWSPADPAKESWIRIRYDQPRTIIFVRIWSPWGPIPVDFEFQARVDGRWETLFAGKELGRWFKRDIPPVTASEYRLVIRQAGADFTIHDIELVEP
jgi:alpha-L-fucosidase